METNFKPGNASYSSTPTQATEVFRLENMDRDVDGMYRPRWGMEHLQSFASACTHLSRHPNGHALMVIYAGGKLGYYNLTDSTLTELATGWPTTPVKAATAPGAPATWVAHKAGISSDTPGSLYEVDDTGTYAIVTDAPVGTWVETHNRILFSLNTDTNVIRWSDYDDYLVWPVANDATKMPGSMGAEAMVPYSNNRSVIFGQAGLFEVTGSVPEDIGFAQLQNLAVAMPATVIIRCGDCILFLCPGPRLLKFQFGRCTRIDWPVNKDFRALNSITDLRAWHDAGRNLFCLTDTAATPMTTYLYSLEEERWVGTWTAMDDGTEPIMGGASLTGANDQPYVLEYVALGLRLCRWDPTLYVDDTGPSTSEAFWCRIETRPSNLDDQRSLKRIRGIYCDVSGLWYIKLKYRNTADAAWTTVDWGGTTGPGMIPAPSRIECREFTIFAEAPSNTGTPATQPRFRALSVDVQTVSRAKR